MKKWRNQKSLSRLLFPDFSSRTESKLKAKLSSPPHILLPKVFPKISPKGQSLPESSTPKNMTPHLGKV